MYENMLLHSHTRQRVDGNTQINAERITWETVSTANARIIARISRAKFKKKRRLKQ